MRYCLDNKQTNNAHKRERERKRGRKSVKYAAHRKNTMTLLALTNRNKKPSKNHIRMVLRGQMPKMGMRMRRKMEWKIGREKENETYTRRSWVNGRRSQKLCTQNRQYYHRGLLLATTDKYILAIAMVTRHITKPIQHKNNKAKTDGRRRKT